MVRRVGHAERQQAQLVAPVRGRAAVRVEPTPRLQSRAATKMATVPADATPGAIAHDQTTETYIIVSGAGTLVTGGKIVNGNRSAPDSEVTRVLNGPSCSGPTIGNVVKKVVKTGDIIVIPAGVPHGWTDITDHVDYLSVRPDPDKVLEHGACAPGDEEVSVQRVCRRMTTFPPSCGFAVGSVTTAKSRSPATATSRAVPAVSYSSTIFGAERSEKSTT